MHFKRVEESLDGDNRSAPGVDGTIEVVQDLGLLESGRKTIPWIFIVNGPACIGNQLVSFVVDGDYDAAFEKAGSLVQPEAKCTGCFRGDASSRQIRVAPVYIV